MHIGNVTFFWHMSLSIQGDTDAEELGCAAMHVNHHWENPLFGSGKAVCGAMQRGMLTSLQELIKIYLRILHYPTFEKSRATLYWLVENFKSKKIC